MSSLQPHFRMHGNHITKGNFYGAEGGTIPQIFYSRWMQEFKSQPLKRKIKKGKKENWLPVVSPSQPIFPFVPSLPLFSTCSLPLLAPLFPFFPLFSSIVERLLLQLCLVLSSSYFSILISTLLHRLVGCGCVLCSHLHTPP